MGGAASGAIACDNGLDQGDSTSTAVPQSVLGRTGIQISRLGIGCAPFQHKQLGVKEVAEVLHRGLELGVNFLDVAPNYGNSQTGFSEEKMGPTIKEIRARVFLVTKTEELTFADAEEAERAARTIENKLDSWERLRAQMLEDLKRRQEQLEELKERLAAFTESFRGLVVEVFAILY